MDRANRFLWTLRCGPRDQEIFSQAIGDICQVITITLVQLPTIKAETLKKDQMPFQEILSNADLDALFAKHCLKNERKQKLFVRCFLAIVRLRQTTLREYLLLYERGGIAACKELNFNQPKSDLDDYQDELPHKFEQKPEARLAEAVDRTECCPAGSLR